MYNIYMYTYKPFELVFFTGVYFIEVTSLKEPAKFRMIRSLDENFLSALKNKLEADPSAPGVPTVAVLCQDVQVSILD